MSLERQVCIPITFQLLRFRQSSGQDFITAPRACQGFLETKWPMFFNIGTSAAMLAGCSLALGVSTQL
jgi:hypothetical protein